MRFILVALCFFSLLAVADTKTEKTKKKVMPYKFETNADWRSEVIPFPLGFAPSIKYKGWEELRFAPGMFKPESETYFCYAFVMWIEGHKSVDESELKSMLLTYYQGLYKAVAGSRKLTPSQEKNITVTVQKDEQDVFTGEIQWWDAFTNHNALTLKLRTTVKKAEGHTAIFAIVAPKEANKKAWGELETIEEKFLTKNVWQVEKKEAAEEKEE